VKNLDAVFPEMRWHIHGVISAAILRA
jgi:hypothetical protein